MYSIAITTFSKRLEIVCNLIDQIRSFNTTNHIILAINGDCNKPFDNSYRTKILQHCLKHNDVYPIFFPEFRGLTKMWNTLSIHSSTEINLILNDDVEITTNDIFSYLDNINTLDTLQTINNSFCHFILSKKTLEDLNFFDERFLGFGEEDGDIVYRHIEKFNKPISNVYLHGIHSLASNIRDNSIAIGKHPRYTSFNESFAFGAMGPKYVPTSTPTIITGFVPHQTKVLNDENQYPYESFFRKNKMNL